MGTYGTKPGGGGKFGSKPTPADSVDDMVCHPASILAQPSDPPPGDPELSYDMYEVVRDDRKYDQWVKDSGCAAMSYLLLNMDEYWDEIDALPWEGKPHKGAGTNFPWKTLPNIFNNENLNELADCMMKNYGVDIKKGLPADKINEFFECKAFLMRKKFGIEIPPPKEYDLASTFSPPVGCPPLCLEQNVVLLYSWTSQQYKLVPSHTLGSIGKFFGATPTGWSIVKGKRESGAHALKAKVVSCDKLKICFEGYDGYPQGGSKWKICIAPNGKVISHEGSYEHIRGCKKVLDLELGMMKDRNLAEPILKECWERVSGVGRADGSEVYSIVTESDCTETVQGVK